MLSGFSCVNRLLGLCDLGCSAAMSAMQAIAAGGFAMVINFKENEDMTEETLKNFDNYNREKQDMVNNPPHYKQHPSGVECITVTEHFNFNTGNAIKYLWRSEHKNGLEDLEKAQWYIDREIERRTKQEQEK